MRRYALTVARRAVTSLLKAHKTASQSTRTARRQYGSGSCYCIAWKNNAFPRDCVGGGGKRPVKLGRSADAVAGGAASSGLFRWRDCVGAGRSPFLPIPV